MGHEPVPLERVSTYRGLTSRSIRVINTLLLDNSLINAVRLDDASQYAERPQEDS